MADRGVQVVGAPSDVTEGDRFTVRLKIGGAAKAKTVQLQMRTKSVFGEIVWAGVKNKKVRGERRHKLSLVAGPTNPLKMRALVTYRDGQKARSKAFRVTTWRWFGLHRFPAYYATSGAVANEFSSFLIAGSAYKGWQGLATGVTSWESRHTPGRNCSTLRGVVGLRDDSLDGSSAQVTVLADETTVAYQSPTLVPGAAHPFTIDLGRPYRLTIRAQLGSTVRATPALGAPELLCDYDSDEVSN
jgi:hypothetical protein